MIEFIKMEVVWNEGEHFRTVREKLDKFSTFGGIDGKAWVQGRSRSAVGIRCLSGLRQLRTPKRFPFD